jgi:hypothetical protein
MHPRLFGLSSSVMSRKGAKAAKGNPLAFLASLRAIAFALLAAAPARCERSSCRFHPELVIIAAKPKVER